MRGSIKKTPTSSKQAIGAGSGVGGDGGNESEKMSSAEKRSGRKLVQARLPFKIIATATEVGVSAAKDGSSEGEIKSNPRKRKLYETQTEQGNKEESEAVAKSECSKENVSAARTTKKSKTTESLNDNNDGGNVELINDTNDDDVFVVLDDSDKDDDVDMKSKQTPKSKKNENSLKSNTPKSDKIKLSTKSNEKSAVGKKPSNETPKSKITKTPKLSDILKGVVLTPITLKDMVDGSEAKESSKAKNVQSDKHTDVDEEKVKDSVTGALNEGASIKRRKSLRTIEKTIITAKAKKQKESSSESSDDAEAIEQNPQKRLKLATSSNVSVVINKKGKEEKKDIERKNSQSEITGSVVDLSDSLSSNNDDDQSITTSINAEDTTIDEKNTTLGTPSALNKSPSNGEKVLTPKQKKLFDQRRKAREEKELKLQKEKEQKQLEKEQRELEKKREREQRDEQRRKEREEKEEQRRKEREEKDQQKRKEREEKDEQKRVEREERERKRNAELESKNEEKRKKEQEKEEAELKKKRAAEAFTKFFVQKPASRAANRISTGGEQEPKPEDNSAVGKQLAFQPFQIKGDMKLAPIKRKTISQGGRSKLDGILHYDGDGNEEIVRSKPLQKSQLYVSELKLGKITPSKWVKPSQDLCPDVIIIDDGTVGQAIDVEHKLPVEHLRAKFFKFHENRRPPYYGTWRKKTSVIKPRKPFAQDKKFLDYEVDSDLEWEEEEPGESLDGSDDEKEKESEDEEDYEVDNEWFVPHGHLSDEELQNDDEFDDGNTREAQKAKLQILQQEFAQEMRKQTKKIKPRLIGCIWTDINGNKPEECPQIIWESLQRRAMICMGTPISLEEPTPSVQEEETNPSPVEKPKPIVLSIDLQKDLVRLMHGNNHSKNFLISEYLAYLNINCEAIRSGEALLPSKVNIRERIDEIAEWQIIERTAYEAQQTTQLNGNSNNGAATTKKQKKPKKRLCWIVADDVLKRLELEELTLANNWNYISPPKNMANNKETKINNLNEANESGDEDEQQQQQANGEANITSTTTAALPTTPTTNSTVKNNNVVSITKFTKVLTAKELRKAATTTSVVAGSPSTSSTIKNNVDATSHSNTNTNTTGPSSSTKNNSISSTSSPTTNAQKKKRVPLLMSVPRGEQIPTATKVMLISKFLKKGADPNNTTFNTPTTTIKSSNPTTNPTISGKTKSSTAIRKPTVIDDDNAVADDDEDILILD